ncbi:MAG: P1 family peptidase [Firmicutes bacterium]|nr:P1 family peptidase [Bacillota bacterium]
MFKAITDVSGIRVGQVSDREALTGCTVIISPQGAVAGVDVRGSAPGTRETDALDPLNLVEKIHAVVLTGGSAFGLDAAGGVMEYLEGKGIGYDVGVTRVPIVAAAVLFDLGIGNPRVRPDGAMGYQAAAAAGEGPVEEGNVGAGTGATVGKLLNPQGSMKSGLGTTSLRVGDLIVGALVAVNAWGDVVDPATGKILAGALGPGNTFIDTEKYLRENPYTPPRNPGNTTIGVVATNARLEKTGAAKVAQQAQDGYARAIRPVHTMLDGDTTFCLATGQVTADLNQVGSLAAQAMAEAILRAVRQARGAGGLPAAVELAGREKP